MIIDVDCIRYQFKSVKIKLDANFKEARTDELQT